ncbi:uncharacterized protein G2W53_002302 [Senna tora]|uniref:Uncharacterized protein n=1 Tax=Senna tora TaxID=362788 RepID=A0A834XHV1_9FABA|nr:uncharacterized protein G2W53_002302 [Senna tora]
MPKEITYYRNALSLFDESSQREEDTERKKCRGVLEELHMTEEAFNLSNKQIGKGICYPFHVTTKPEESRKKALLPKPKENPKKKKKNPNSTDYGASINPKPIQI